MRGFRATTLVVRLQAAVTDQVLTIFSSCCFVRRSSNHVFGEQQKLRAKLTRMGDSSPLLLLPTITGQVRTNQEQQTRIAVLSVHASGSVDNRTVSSAGLTAGAGGHVDLRAGLASTTDAAVAVAAAAVAVAAAAACRHSLLWASPDWQLRSGASCRGRRAWSDLRQDARLSCSQIGLLLGAALTTPSPGAASAAG